MRAIYVNLDRSTDRRDWMEEQARRVGITLERFSAVDGSLMERNPFPDVPIGAAGCFLSHRAVWSEIANGKDQFVLVLEDDAHLSPDLSSFLADTSWIPQDADIVHIEWTQKYAMTTGRARAALTRRIKRTVGGGTGTGGYVISRKCAARLADTFTSINIEFDQILFNHPSPDLVIYKLFPALSIQDKLTATPFLELMIEREIERAKPEPRPGFREKILRETRRLARKIWAMRPAKIKSTRVDFR